MVMASSVNFISLYVGLELLSLSLYALVSIERDSARGAEAAMKYFVLGSLASGLLLYGMSMVYGATGSLDVVQIARGIAASQANPLLALFGLDFRVTGIGFKLGAVPFHMWVPDVYDGAPGAACAADRLSAEARRVRVHHFRLLAEALAGFAPDWSEHADDPRRAVADRRQYRRDRPDQPQAHARLLDDLAHGIPAARHARRQPGRLRCSFFYAMTYMLTAAAGFGMILLLAHEGFEADRIVDFKGLAKRSRGSPQ